MSNSALKFKNAFYLPSGRVFLLEAKDGYKVECTEMRDVSTKGKEHQEVRAAQDPRVIWRHLVPYEDKWLLNVSTQRGCAHKCRFCDVTKMKFKGNLSQEEIECQIETLLEFSPYVTNCSKVKIGFARMGEPAHNVDNVIGAMLNLNKLASARGRSFKWLPCFNSILPRKAGKRSGFDIIDIVMATKELSFGGSLHFQISCNSTSEEKRKYLTGGADILTLKEIIGKINSGNVTNRTITLNFIVMKGVEVDVNKLLDLGLNKDKFTVKLIPLNATLAAEQSNLETLSNYSNCGELLKLGEEFNRAGIPTVVDFVARCEESGLCCGQLASVLA